MLTSVMRKGKASISTASSPPSSAAASSPTTKTRIYKPVDIVDLGIAHRIASFRRAAAMHHQMGPSPPERPVIFIGETDVEGPVAAAVRQELSAAHPIEAFRCLLVAGPELGPETA